MQFKTEKIMKWTDGYVTDNILQLMIQALRMIELFEKEELQKIESQLQELHQDKDLSNRRTKYDKSQIELALHWIL